MLDQDCKKIIKEKGLCYGKNHWKEKNATYEALVGSDVSSGHFFFRAMSEEEAAHWLSGKGYDIVLGNGHQGFSPTPEYAEKYLTTYPLILRFSMGDYISKANEIGITQGAKEDDGVMAYGIGWKSKNSIQDTRDTSKTIESKWVENGANPGAIDRIINSVKKTNTNIGEIDRYNVYKDDKRKILNAIYFIESIENVQVFEIEKTLYESLKKMK